MLRLFVATVLRVALYWILGACNPKMAYQALRAEDKIGAMLPCNVVIQPRENGRVEISALNPVASMQAITNPVLIKIAEAVRDMLRKAVQAILAAAA